MNTYNPASQHISSTSSRSPLELAQALFEAARNAKGDLMMASPDEVSARRDEACDTLQSLAAPLRSLDLDDLAPRSLAMAFWINVYNALVIHGVLENKIRESVREVPNFFAKVGYNIGGHDFSLDDIEHGLLRANRGHPMRVALPQLAPWDPRRGAIIKPMDRRIHFALNCGAASCPPIRFYTAENLDDELAMAASSFVYGGGVESQDNGPVLISKLFQWYARDFGLRKHAQLDVALSYIDDAKHRQAPSAAAQDKGIAYKDYDWALV